MDKISSKLYKKQFLAIYSTNQTFIFIQEHM